MADYGLSANAQQYLQGPPAGGPPAGQGGAQGGGSYGVPPNGGITGSATTLSNASAMDPFGQWMYQNAPQLLVPMYNAGSALIGDGKQLPYPTPPVPAPQGGGLPSGYMGIPPNPVTQSSLFPKTNGTVPPTPSYNVLGSANGGTQGGPQGGQNYGFPPSSVPNTLPPVGAGGGGGTGARPGGLPDPTRDLSTQAREWLRLKPMADKYGASLDQLVNVYMNPNDPHAKTDLQSALSEKIADDVWAKAFTMATGRPPQGNEWDEHYYAKTEGRRDPLEGHPGAVQYIQQAARDMAGENQQAAYQTYNDLITSGLV